MSYEMLKPLFLTTLALVACWVLVTYLLTLYSDRFIERQSQAERPASTVPIVVLSYLGLLITPAGLLAIVAPRRDSWLGVNSHLDGLVLVFVGVMLPILLGVVVAILLNRQRSRRGPGLSRRRPPKVVLRHVAAQFLLVSAFPLAVLMVMAMNSPLSLATLIAMFVFILLFFWTRSFKVPQSKRAFSQPLREMEESPLRHELDSIISRFCNPKAPLQITRGTARHPTKEPTREAVAVGLSAWWYGFDPRRPVIPKELISLVDPDAVTAAVALLCSQRYRARVLPPGKKRQTPSLGKVAYAIVFCVGMSFMFLGLVGNSVGTSVGGIAIVMISSLVMRYFRIASSQTVYSAAYRVWSGSDLIRNPVRFSLCLTQIDVAMQPNQPGEELEKAIRAHRGIIDFLESFGMSRKQKALDAIHEYLKEQKGEEPAPDQGADQSQSAMPDDERVSPSTFP